MGCFGSKDKLSKEDMDFLKSHTRYDEATIKEWYKGFKSFVDDLSNIITMKEYRSKKRIKWRYLIYVIPLLFFCATVLLTIYQKNTYSSYEYSDYFNHTKWLYELQNEVADLAKNDDSSTELFEKTGINVVLSNKLPLLRKLRDPRDPQCNDIKYNVSLPSASVIIVFYNEPWSVLLRTIFSVLQETPPKLLKEIILVDDGSDQEELIKILNYFLGRRLPKKVKLIRTKQRGIVNARLTGVKRASADVLVFLDAQCEVTKNWLTPLLQRVKEKPNTIAVPIIDVISPETLEYFNDFVVRPFPLGGFSWNGDFTWIKGRKTAYGVYPVSPVKTPTMPGGIFAINKKYFWDIGSYDEGMEGWGGENIEMSLRVWQCGGTIEIIPCSRVGHIFKKFLPHEYFKDKDNFLINSARMAHVWMDEYSKLFLLHNQKYLKNIASIGDVSDRIQLRKDLQCESFKWYLKNVYPEKFIPYENIQGYGKVGLLGQNLCLDRLDNEDFDSYFLSLNTCFDDERNSQLFSLSNSGELRTEMRCAIIDVFTLKIRMISCEKNVKEKIWKYSESGSLINLKSGLCLDAIDDEYGLNVKAAVCMDTPTQHWRIF